MGDIAANIQDNSQSPGEMDVNQELVSQIQERIKEAMPSVQQMAQFEGTLQKNPELAQTLAKVCPELIMAFVAAAQEAQGADSQQQQTGMTPPGAADGATAPQVGADDLPTPQAPTAPQAPAQAQAPAATTNGNPPPSVPGDSSPLRKQFYTGR